MKSFATRIMENISIDKVKPIYGSILHCSLYGGEHTGIYVDNDLVVELIGTGEVKLSSYKEFIRGTNALNIYIACNNEKVLSYAPAADRALKMIGKTRKYHLLKDNCHQFTSGCIIDEFDNDHNYFYTLENIIINKMNQGEKIKWKAWGVECF